MPECPADLQTADNAAENPAEIYDFRIQNVSFGKYPLSAGYTVIV
jgi:hypothetical protein